MRFLRLDLLAYGHFTNVSLAFPAGGPGLHLIYGRNEAGKSTTLRAIKGFLYGIDRRTGDTHLHPASSLRVGAQVQHSSGTTRVFVRRKGNSGTLLDEHGSTVDDAELGSWLSVADRNQFELMFGLSHDQLRRAGEALADTESAVGRMLFGAALNGTALRVVSRNLEDEAQRLFSARGSAGAFNKALQAYRDLKREAMAQGPAREWSELQAEGRRLEIDLAKHTADLVEQKGVHRRLERLRRALPAIHQRDEVIVKRAALGEVRLVAPEVAERRREVLRRLETATEAVRRIESQMQSTRVQCDAETVLDSLALLRPRIRELQEALGSFKDARQAIPNIIKEIVGYANNERRALGEIGLPELRLEELESIRVDEATLARIRALGSERVRLGAQLAQMREDLARKHAAVAACENVHASLPPPTDTAVLRMVWQGIQVDRHLDDAVQAAENRADAEDGRVREVCRALVPWEGPPEVALTIRVPDAESIQRIAQSWVDVHREQASIESSRDRLRTELQRIVHEQAANGEGGELPSEARLADARSRRDRGWQRVLRAWADGKSPLAVDEAVDADVRLSDAYARSVLTADADADALRHAADRVAAAAARRSARTAAEDGLREHDVRLELLAKRHLDQQAEWYSLWRQVGIDPAPPTAMLAWRSRYDVLVAALRDRDEARRHAAELRARLDERRSTLEQALVDSGLRPPSMPWRVLTSFVEQRISESEERSRLLVATQTELRKLRAETLDAEARLAAGEQPAARNQGEWADVMRRLRLDANARVEEADVVIDRLRQIFEWEEARRRQEKRLTAVKKNVEQEFPALVDELLVHFPPEFSGRSRDAAVNADQLIAGFEANAKAAARRAVLTDQLEASQRELAVAEVQLSAATALRDGLLHEVACETLDEVRALESASAEARELDHQLAALESQLHNIGDGYRPSELAIAATEIGPGGLDAQIAVCEAEMKRLDDARQTVTSELGAHRVRSQKFAGGEDGARLLGEAHEHLSVARVHAERYARLRLATLLLERAVESYRKKNEGAVLHRAGELFKRLTLGRYEDLRLVYDDDGARLRCVRQGQVVDVGEALSDGTRDQLFLALRLASLEHHLAQQEPMPLVLDDIFIHFDDDRARAGLEVLAEVATKTQVLLLTHHARNLELAKGALASTQWSAQFLSPTGGAAAS